MIMEITTGTGLGAFFTTITLFWINSITSKHSVSYVIPFACKHTKYQIIINNINYLLFLSCTHYMPRVTASSRRLSECHPFVDGDVLAITDEVETNFNPVSSLPESKFVREPSTKLRTVQHQIEEIQHQSVSITRENTRLNQRNVNLDLEKNSNQVVTVAPSKTQMVELTTPSPSTSSSTAWPLPTPFDVGFNHNITVTCQNFMSGMLSSSIFKQCSPISMLLQNSNSFFQASKNLLRITSLLDNSCGAPVSVCSELLHSYSQNLTKHDACGLDLLHSNPQIESALLGLRAYQILYTVSCLRTSSPVVNINQKGHPITPNQTFSSIGRPEDSYCFADALTNISNPSNSFIYYLPLNVSLVGSAVPTCTTCLQSTMSVFQLATANRSSIIASNYAKAASQVNVVCGPEFVNASLTAAVSSANLIGAKRSLLILFWILLYFTFIE